MTAYSRLGRQNRQCITKAIYNKGFIGNTSIQPRSNFGVGGQESSPKSLTTHSLNRWQQCRKKLDASNQCDNSDNYVVNCTNSYGFPE
jgi:hypothetical protein